MELNHIRADILEAESEGLSALLLRERLDDLASSVRIRLGEIDLVDMAGRLRDSPNERLFAAMLLRESWVGETAISGYVRSALRTETDDQVIAELVTTLAFTRDADAVSELISLARHRSSSVRFQVASALGRCGGTGHASVAELVHLLANDNNDDVRWSAGFELLAVWNESRDVRVKQALASALQNDSNAEIRNMIREEFSAPDDSE
jgi:HEAT repeat protein